MNLMFQENSKKKGYIITILKILVLNSHQYMMWKHKIVVIVILLIWAH